MRPLHIHRDDFIFDHQFYNAVVGTPYWLPRRQLMDQLFRPLYRQLYGQFYAQLYEEAFDEADL